jgi:hypothetical protein
MIKSRNLRWAENVAHMEGKEMLVKFWYRNLKERAHLEDLGIYGGIILN